ncbi:hypothetical protein NY08_247 [Rhodococcus sp. B7740]|nr:hypothetical protein NY08_247 [Rhodococcus sp. B7740]
MRFRRRFRQGNQVAVFGGFKRPSDVTLLTRSSPWFSAVEDRWCRRRSASNMNGNIRVRQNAELRNEPSAAHRASEGRKGPP